MPDMNNFFNELIQNDYFEKQASENESIKNALEDCSSSVLQKLAQELGALSEEKATTLQEKLAATEEDEEEADKETNTEEKDGECKAEDSETDEPEQEGEKEDEKDAECEPEKEEEQEDEKEDQEEAQKEDEKEAEDDTEAEEDEEKEDDEKEAFEREAYFAAQEKLASHNLSIADFVFEKCANEDVAEYIAETAEKLACLCDKSALQIADEIFDSVMNKLG